MHNFNDDISTPEKFVVTLELVTGRDFSGGAIDTITQISKDAYDDGRITAVSITDNPGGNPALSPDAIGREILDYGLDVIVHFTCRDTNRMGMESRALQLARMGMKNILALTGDYSGKGFGGRGTPVFDFDSVILTSMLNDLNKRLIKTGHSEVFVTGCAISPFKYTEAESWIQYRKLQRKIEAGASLRSPAGLRCRQIRRAAAVQPSEQHHGADPRLPLPAGQGPCKHHAAGQGAGCLCLEAAL